jgi:hypothetical protein
MKQSIIMDAAELPEAIRPGDLMHPPDWEQVTAYDEVLSVREVLTEIGGHGKKTTKVEVISRRTLWSLDPDEQVEVVRP